MERKRVPGSKAGRRATVPKTRSGRGLRVIEREGYWYIHGTLRIGKRSIRIRRGTGLPATADYRDEAETLCFKKEQEIRDQVVHGRTPSAPISLAAKSYLSAARDRPLNATSIRHVQASVRRFGTRMLEDIADDEWLRFVADAAGGWSAETRERFLNSIVAFLNFCRKRPNKWIAELPPFERNNKARNPTTRKRRRIEELRPELIAWMVEHASPHLKGVIAAEWSTGGRVSSVLFQCRVCDLVLAPGREKLTFHGTKNGEDVDAALHPWAAERLREYIAWRGVGRDREAPLFLTHLKKPYTAAGGTWGTPNKTAWNAMKRRAARAWRRRAAAVAWPLRREPGGRARAGQMMRGAWADAAVMRKVTQHWFRHMLATEIMATAGDPRAVMEQGGWLDIRSVMGYTHDIPEHRRRLVNQRAFDPLNEDERNIRGKLERQ